MVKVTFRVTTGKCGGLSRARGLEWLGLLHVTMQFTRGTTFGSAIKVVDPAG